MTSEDTSLFSVRSWESLRAFLYVVTPLVIMATVVSPHAHLWVGLVMAVLAPALSAVKSVNGFRTWFYGVLTAAQALLVGLEVFTEAQFAPWLLVINAVVGGAVAASNVHEG